jgi:hypothetical protein
LSSAQHLPGPSRRLRAGRDLTKAGERECHTDGEPLLLAGTERIDQ